MRQLLKTKRLLGLYESNKNIAHSELEVRLSVRTNHLELMQQSFDQYRAMTEMLEAQQLRGADFTRAALYDQRRRQAVLLSAMQNLATEQTLQKEQLEKCEAEVDASRQRVAFLERKHFKFTGLMQSMQRNRRLRDELVSDNDINESIPWLLQSK